MRSVKEIDHAREQLLDAFRGAVENNDTEAMSAISGMIKTLEWVKGDNTPGGFGDMIRDMNRIEKANTN